MEGLIDWLRGAGGTGEAEVLTWQCGGKRLPLFTLCIPGSGCIQRLHGAICLIVIAIKLDKKDSESFVFCTTAPRFVNYSTAPPHIII